jgi:hypothetical protein
MTDLSPHIDSWHATQRIESWAGEVRVNMIRMIGIALFYGRHFFDVMLNPGAVDQAYHHRVTAVAVIWAVAAMALHWLLVRRRYCPPTLHYATIAFDAFMIALLCTIAGGPRTPLMLLFFPLIAMAPLRLSLPVVYASTVAAAGGYLIVVAYYAWYEIGIERYYSTPHLRIPRSEQAIYVLAMIVTGLLAGQMVRQARRIARGPHLQIAAEPSTTAPAEQEG